MHQSYQSQEEVVKLKAPNKYNVVLINDDATPMEFVIQILMIIFTRTSEDAGAIMMEVHEKGKGVAGTYSYEIAEQKVHETISQARSAGYPLDAIVEEA